MKCLWFIPLLVMSLLSAAAPAHAEAKSSQFNEPGQHRTRTCAAMKGARIPLRFADGTPTGFFAQADDPSRNGSLPDCPPGSLELDAQEILTTGDGMSLLFHPGGGPGNYDDHVENGQYGHVAVADLPERPKLSPVGSNGKPAPAGAGVIYLITPTRIPKDMFYKPNANDRGTTGSTYYTYGNPGYDKTGGRGDWTYINWSWVQNGGSVYPDNICRGGGMVRALGRRGMLFAACDVEAIVGYAYGPDNRVNGRVTAFYGRTTTGPGENGSPIFGWLVHSYQKKADIIVPCIRRQSAPAKGQRALKEEKAPGSDRMERMARNLLAVIHPDEPTAGRLRAKWISAFVAEPDPMSRMEGLTEMAQLDEPATVGSMLKLLAREDDARVREQIIVLVGFMQSSSKCLNAVCAAFAAEFGRTESSRERLRVIEIASNFASPETLSLVEKLRGTAKDADTRFACDEAILRYSRSEKVEAALVAEVTDDLKRLAVSDDEAVRSHAVHVLAYPGMDSRAFLTERLQSEPSQALREFLTKATAAQPMP